MATDDRGRQSATSGAQVPTCRPSPPREDAAFCVRVARVAGGEQVVRRVIRVVLACPLELLLQVVVRGRGVLLAIACEGAAGFPYARGRIGVLEGTGA